ncbi:myozenin-3 [Ornithorhynchus anatinus]|uniref:Myozenin 3 n=1 Tax=Ornithorhynchus anatinus TaxID=9258 RepID=A0A6I8NGY4_ORNAN|nr:myozenin-3 [Ornithorhynchus anatinus]
MVPADVEKERKQQAMDIVREMTGQDVSLDLGKKMSVPQDLMMEELSLRTNRGSLLFQKRQRRVQKFTLEYPAGPRRGVTGEAGGTESHDTRAAQTWEAANGPEGKESYRTEIHITPSGQVIPTSGPVGTSQLSSASPSNLAPGYSEPLKGVPPEKFNLTAIPKGYQSPWREFISSKDYQLHNLSFLPKMASPTDYRSFNKTPMPFGGPHFSETFPGLDTIYPLAEPLSGLELLQSRPSFNRVPQGWTRNLNLPESEDL